jgi:hypothetical protein
LTSGIYPSILISLAFLVANGVILRAILALNRRAAGVSPAQPSGNGNKPPEPPPVVLADVDLPADDILGREFEYARVTASEANAERHTMVNFYLLITGVAASGVIAVLGKPDLPTAAGTVLLWLLCEVGWLYFLAILRLRQAWSDSARAMNQIKKFYFEHVQKPKGDVLRTAFRWQPETLPPPDKPWTVYFYAAMVIALLNTAAYIVGAMLIDLKAIGAAPLPVAGTLIVFGLTFFAFHVWLYFAFLRPKGEKHARKSS